MENLHVSRVFYFRSMQSFHEMQGFTIVMLTEGTRGAPALETPARGPHARPRSVAHFLARGETVDSGPRWRCCHAVRRWRCHAVRRWRPPRGPRGRRGCGVVLVRLPPPKARVMT